MGVPARATDKSVATGDSGELREMHLHKSCGYAACQEPGIASVGDENLCCDHFVLRSYELLQRIDAERAKNDSSFRQSTALKSSVNSCLQGALDVSLRSAALNNLQKARLLDIMLWAGEYIHSAEPRRPGGLHLAGGATSNPEERAPYQKPEVRSRTTLLPQ